ncbi:MAG: hypothetical protein IPM48_07025 [Saprospiraceae bacterium]|nr:hypothetical protein [Saprospiraceae bacterium]
MKEDLQLALDYLDNVLSQEDRLAFENRLSTEQELRLLLEDIEKSKQLSRYLIEIETRNVLNAIQKQRSNTKWMYWLAAASVALLICVPFYLKHQPNIEPSKQELFALMVDPAPMQLRSDSLLIDDLSEAMQHYQNKHYNVVISRLEKLSVDSIYFLQYQRYLAHAYLRTENWKKSDSIFSILSNNSVLEISMEAIYHRCIVAIAIKDKTKANELFQIIQASSLISNSNKQGLGKLIGEI